MKHAIILVVNTDTPHPLMGPSAIILATAASSGALAPTLAAFAAAINGKLQDVGTDPVIAVGIQCLEDVQVGDTVIRNMEVFEKTP